MPAPSASQAVFTSATVAETVLSVIGAGIAGTLWWAHRANIDLPCTSGGGCITVNNSPWAHITLGPIHDMPVALAGFLTYLILFSLAMAKLAADADSTRRRLHWPLWAIATFGTGYSWYLQYVAHFRVGAFCVWCFSSAVTMTLLWLVASWEGLRRLRPSASSPSEARPPAHV